MEKSKKFQSIFRDINRKSTDIVERKKNELKMDKYQIGME